MNTNIVRSQRHNARLQYTPLEVSCQLQIMTVDSPPIQEYDEFTGDYNPNRGSTPCVIRPDVRAVDHDETGFSRSVNYMLSLDSDKLVWYLDGRAVDANRDTHTNKDFVILTGADEMRGTLQIYRNYPPSETHDLYFMGTFEDWRTGQVIQIQSEHIQLGCTNKAPDSPAFSLSRESFRYDPVYDTLLLYDYLRAHGVDDSSLPDTDKGKQYKIEVKAQLTIGNTPVEDLASLTALGYTMRVVRKGTSTALVPMSSASPDLVSAYYPEVVFDARHIDKNEYAIQIMDGDDVYMEADLAIYRKTTMPNPTLCKPFYETDLPAIQGYYTNKVFIPEVPYPECVFDIRWHTQRWNNPGGSTSPSYGTVKDWQWGEELWVSAEDIGISAGSPDTVFDVWFDVQELPVAQRALDEDGNNLTDENGNKLLI